VTVNRHGRHEAGHDEGPAPYAHRRPVIRWGGWYKYEPLSQHFCDLSGQAWHATFEGIEKGSYRVNC
jgi:hypothetical protein